MRQARTHAIGSLLARVAIPAALGGYLLWRGRPIPAAALGTIAAVLLLAGLFLPALYGKIDRLGRAFGRLVATALTWVLLVPMFFLVFAPGRLVLKLRGVDPLTRKCPSSEPTYWVPRKPVSGDADYKRQF